jgi:NADP-reducing hydrogenase subunit HndB
VSRALIEHDFGSYREPTRKTNRWRAGQLARQKTGENKMVNKVKTLDDLRKLREEALEKRRVKSASGQIQIVVGMGTVGIAAGARETLKAILDYIEQENLSEIIVRQTGNIGMDSMEPIVQVVIGENPKVTYGKVTPDVARRIMKEHVAGGQIVKENAVEA